MLRILRNTDSEFLMKFTILHHPEHLLRYGRVLLLTLHCPPRLFELLYADHLVPRVVKA